MEEEELMQEEDPDEDPSKEEPMEEEDPKEDPNYEERMKIRTLRRILK